MAYNRRNYLKKVLKVQEVTLREQKKGKTYKQIYYQHIEREFHISYKTFSNYLGVNARHQLKKLKDD